MVKNLPASAGDIRAVSSIPGLERSPGAGNGNPLQYFVPGKFHGQRSLVGYSSQVCKELDVTEHTKIADKSTGRAPFICKTANPGSLLSSPLGKE